MSTTSLERFANAFEIRIPRARINFDKISPVSIRASRSFARETRALPVKTVASVSRSISSMG
jgi:hypothetical protein